MAESKNFYTLKRETFEEIDKTIIGVINRKGKENIKYLYLKLSGKFGMSKKTIMDRIQEYEELGLIEIKEDYLYSPEYKKQGDKKKG